MPTVNIGSDTTICDNVHYELNAGNPGNSVLWSTGSQEQIVIPNATGWYHVVITNPFDCSSSDSAYITLSPSPHVFIGNDTSICESKSIILNASQPLSMYLWSTGSSDSMIQVGLAGNYHVKATNIHGCVDMDTITITMDSLPILDFTTAITQRTVQFSGITRYANSYEWDFGDGSTSVQPNPSHTYSANGTYTVQLNGSNSCGSRMIQHQVTVLATGIQNVPEQWEISVYPNPAYDKLFVDIALPEHSCLNIKLFDMSGKATDISIYENRETGLHHFVFPLTQLPAGVYLLQILNDTGLQKTYRVLIHR